MLSRKCAIHIVFSHKSGRMNEVASTAVVIMDQEPKRSITIGKFPDQLPGLLSNPELIGIGGDSGKVNTARVQFDEEEHVDGLK